MRRYARPEAVGLAVLVALAASLSLGDVAERSPPTSALLAGVHALAPVATGCALLSALTRWVRTRQAVRTPSGVLIAAGVWLAVQAASALAAPSEYRSAALGVLPRAVGGVALAWAVTELCSAPRRWRTLLQALAVGGISLAVVSLGQAGRVPLVAEGIDALQEGSIPIGDVPRANATLSHPNEAAMLLELCVPLVIAWAWTARGRAAGALTLAVAACSAALVLTFSRAGILAGAVAVLGLVLAAARRQRTGRVTLVVTPCVVMAALAGALGWAALNDPGLDRRLLAGLDEASAAQPSRSVFWATAARIAGDHPLLGVGPDNFRWTFSAYAGVPADNLGIHAHDQYLEALADTGVVGLLSFLALLALVLRAGTRAATAAVADRGDWPWRAALVASLAAWVLHALLDDFERFWPTSVAFWLLVGLVMAQRQSRLPVEQPVHGPDDRDDDQQHEYPGRAGQGAAATPAPAEAHHGGQDCHPRARARQEPPKLPKRRPG